MIICDTCKKDVTPGKHKYDTWDDGEEWVEYRIVRFEYGNRMCFCNDCLHTLLEFAGSEEHLQKTIQYHKQMVDERREYEDDNGDVLSNEKSRFIKDETSVREVLPGDIGYEDADEEDKEGFFSNLLSRPNRSKRGGRGLQ